MSKKTQQSQNEVAITEIRHLSLMNSKKRVILLHSLYWLIHTKDESKHGTVFAFIFGVKSNQIYLYSVFQTINISI